MAATALATLDDLRPRLEFQLDDEHMILMAEAALVDASVLVREYGVASWSADNAPPIAVMLTLKASARFMNNPMMLETARGADETNMWGASNANGVHLEPEEIELLREHRKVNRGFQSAPTYLYGTQPHPQRTVKQLRVVGYGNGDAKYFPFYTSEDDPYEPYYPSEHR